MTTNMWLTATTMILAIIIACANDCPALQVLLAVIIYAIIIALVVMEILM